MSLASVSTNFDMPHEESSFQSFDTGLGLGVSQSAKILIRYVFCKNLFSAQISEECITNLSSSDSDSFSFIRDMIKKRHGVPGSMMLEFYSHEGYPLNMNEYKRRFSLSKWKIEGGSLLYVFARKIRQPSLKSVIGSDTGLQPLPAFRGANSCQVTVHSLLSGEFSLHLDLTNDKGLDVKRRVFGHTGIHPSLFELFDSKGAKVAVDKTFIKTEKLFMVTKSIYQFPDGSFEIYGACTYEPIVEQTKAGMAKFYSILYYLVKSDLIGASLREKIVTYFDKEYDCPPLTYSLKVLFQHRSLSQFSMWVCLVEGLYQLFSAILKIFWNVPDDSVFEFSDYIWGMIIQQAKKVTTSLDWTDVTLQCPISASQMIDPVRIPGCDSVYDRRSVLKKKEANEAIEGHTLQTLALEQITPDTEIQRLLMCFTFSDIKDVPTWNKSCTPKKTMRYVSMPADVSWESMETCKSELQVETPDKLDRANLGIVLTYYKEGLLAVYLRPSKQKDKSCVIYNPLFDYSKSGSEAEETVILSDMSQLKGKVKEKKLTDFVNPKARVSLGTKSVMQAARTDNVLPTQTMNFIPKEAIVILLDTSTSMRSQIYPEKGEDYTRMRAAKDLFTTCVDRTSAYQFHHVIGLTQFASKVTVEIPLTDEYIAFCDQLEKLTGNGNTSLYDAISSAISQLLEYGDKFPDCHRRILCLTDGEDNVSKSKPTQLLATLRASKIVLDTVLITGSGGNVAQKALTHASGGYCFFPETMAEATKVFEIETLLSIRERTEQKLEGGLEVYQSVQSYPYNSCDPYGMEDVCGNFSKTLDRGKFIAPQRLVKRSLLLGLGSVSGAVTSSRVKRIMREIRQYNNDPHGDIDIYPSEESVAVWKVVMCGAEHTPYAGGTFLLYVKFPEQYPDKPPQIRFDTPIYHCNINSCGRICHSSLDSRYVPTMSMKNILSYIYGLMMDPEPADPLDSVLALELRQNRAEYEHRARQVTQKFAMKQSRDQLKRDIVQESEDANSGDLLVCPLTQKVFEDPVDTQYGHTYEKSALFKYLDENSDLDPIAKQVVDRAQIRPNASLKQVVSAYRSTSRAAL